MRKEHIVTYLRLPPVKSPLGWKISPSRVTLGVPISLLKATYEPSCKEIIDEINKKEQEKTSRNFHYPKSFICIMHEQIQTFESAQLKRSHNFLSFSNVITKSILQYSIFCCQEYIGISKSSANSY